MMTTTMSSGPLKIVVALWLGLLQAACGGGSSGSPSVSTLGATNVQYSRMMMVTVNGAELGSSALEMHVDGPCLDVARVAGGTDQQQQFTCRITGMGNLTPRIRTPEGLELASVRVSVPLPQVSMTVTQGSRTGTFVVELDPVAAPLTVDNFLAYVAAGFYRNTIFHRVEPGFVVQAGGYTTALAVKPPTNAAIALESGNGLKNLRGTIAMARTAEPNSATSQFYLNLADNPSLDAGSAANVEGYAVFGKVVSGIEVVDEIGKVETRFDLTAGLPNVPVTNVVITAVSQSR